MWLEICEEFIDNRKELREKEKMKKVCGYLCFEKTVKNIHSFCFAFTDKCLKLNKQ